MTSKRLFIRQSIIAGIAIATLALTAACAPESKSAQNTSEPAVIEEKPLFAPLRGTEVQKGEATNPSLAVKIDNHESARPHIGLNSTDLVFEELVEGGYTRYAAVWQSSIPELIGPVRSIRPMDPDIVSPLGGVIVYSGGQQQFVDLMKAAPVENLVFDQDQTHFYRDNARIAPHNVILRAQEAIADYSELPAPEQQFEYSSDGASSTAATVGTPASLVSMRFSNIRFPSWEWDEASGLYQRNQEDTPDIDAEGNRITATNVIVLRVPVEMGEVPKTVLEGSGEATFITNGKAVAGTWQKAGRDESLVFNDSEGNVIKLAPGNSWVELVPAAEGTVSVQ
ncbi:DUF3048 domain-containing protein [Lysinibacter sp. HNR]|uniref:DUF3048 domain-containing protein n=1 Tax=Lysinibacter sp. HNR TaxID=3031408 RepID=UPI002434E865|nr:DUF3048 domain-containing protein [Lysinibacter sp. HNR]WGD36995.1 DUF3048 domain-containing protein [Lysinibacter sp. HNR]